MKKNQLVVVAILFSFFLSSIVLADSKIIISDGQLVGKPKKANWSVTIAPGIREAEDGVKTYTGKQDVSFSENKGKTKVVLTSCTKATAAWSPSGEYLLFNCEGGPHFSVPYMQDGYLYFNPLLYDPARRVLFPLHLGKGILYGAAAWVKGSKKNEINLRTFTGYEKGEKTSKITPAQWEKASASSANADPYAEWLIREIILRISEGRPESISSIIKDIPEFNIKDAMDSFLNFKIKEVRPFIIFKMDPVPEDAYTAFEAIAFKKDLSKGYGTFRISISVNVYSSNLYPHITNIYADWDCAQ